MMSFPGKLLVFGIFLDMRWKSNTRAACSLVATGRGGRNSGCSEPKECSTSAAVCKLLNAEVNLKSDLS